MENTQSARAQADRCRRLAYQIESEAVAKELTRLAAEYDAEAAEADTKGAEPMPRTFEDPLDVHSVDGEVVIAGPGRLAGSMTVEAAKESIDRLQTAVDATSDGTDGSCQPTQDAD